MLQNSLLNKVHFRWEYFYIFCALLFGIYFILRIPPLQVMDELKHFQRAYAFAGGQFRCSEGEVKGQYGMYLPSEVVSAETFFGVKEMTHREDIKISSSKISEGAKIHVGKNLAFADQPFCTRSIWTALPQSIGIFFAQLFTSQMSILLYAGRLVNLFVSIVLIFFAIKIIPRGKSIMAFTALLPMFMQQVSSLSADALQYSLLFLFFSTIIYYVENAHTSIGWKKILLISILAFFAIFSKAGYYPFLLLIFLLPQSIFPSKKYAYFYKVSLSILFVLYAVFSYSQLQFNTQVLDQKSQIFTLIGDPWGTLNRIISSMELYFDYYWKSMLGGLGTRDFFLTNIHYVLLLIGGLLLLTKRPQKEISLSTSLMLLLTILCTVCTIMLGIAILEPSSSIESIGLVQGKYFLPLLPLFFFLTAYTPLPKRVYYYCMSGLLILSLILTIQRVEHRYYAVEEIPLTSELSGNRSSHTLIKTGTLEQTFFSPLNYLSGIRILIDSTSLPQKSSYNFLLKEANCQRVLYGTTLSQEQLLPGSTYEINFPVQSESKNKTYCFEILPLINSQNPLKFSLLEESSYGSGTLFIGKKPLSSDLVFSLLYQK